MTISGRITRRVLAAVLVISFGGCATTATIARTDAPDSEAEIVRSDADALFVRGSNGRIYRLDRASVGDIDHPGNVSLTVGGALLGFLGFILLQLSSSERDNATIPLAIAYGLPGAALFGVGAFQYGKSTSAARPFTDAIGPVYRERRPASPAEDRSRDWLDPRAVEGKGPSVSPTPPLPAIPRPELPPPAPPTAETPDQPDPGLANPSVRRTPHVSAVPRPASPPAAETPEHLTPAPPAP